VNLVAHKHGRAVVLAEEDPDGIEVVVVGLDVPVTIKAPAQARPANTRAAVGHEHEVDSLVADHTRERAFTTFELDDRHRPRLANRRLRDLDRRPRFADTAGVGHETVRVCRVDARSVVPRADDRFT
jgi:hypothetical protein